MKNTHKCPKCESQDIIHIDSLPYHQVQISAFKSIPLARYVCVNCGYCEEWIDSAEDREKLKERYGSE